VLVDSSAFSRDGKKLGLGSSAAVTAATVAAMLEMAGLPVASNRDLCFSLAVSAPRAAQGGVGSGADVAAAVHGGLLQYRRPPNGYPITERLRQPAELRIVLFAEGKPAATPELIRGVKSFAERQPTEYAEAMRPLREQAELFVEALVAESLPDLLKAAEAYGAGLVELGVRSGVAIVTPRFELASDLATNLGGVAKPSGAGGGDVGIGLFGDAEAAETFTSRVQQLGLQVIDAALEPKGVHRRQPSSSV
jgi:phosphomevalonate kinase